MADMVQWWMLGARRLSSTLLVAVVLVVGGMAYRLYTSAPLQLLVQMDPNQSPAWLRWVSKQALFAFHPTVDEVRELNAEAGARYAAMFPDPVEAERILRLFLSRGVDIDSPERLSGAELTALHAAALSADPVPVRLLLAHGADPTARDKHGRTALDLVLAAQANGGGDGFAEVIRLLEAAQLRNTP